MNSWAVDLKDVGAIYPWQGSEVALTIALLVLWVLWHIWQIRSENKTYEDKMARFSDKEEIKRLIQQE